MSNLANRAYSYFCQAKTALSAATRSIANPHAANRNTPGEFDGPLFTVCSDDTFNFRECRHFQDLPVRCCTACHMTNSPNIRMIADPAPGSEHAAFVCCSVEAALKKPDTINLSQIWQSAAGQMGKEIAEWRRLNGKQYGPPKDYGVGKPT
jgi:hypothetical protein